MNNGQLVADMVQICQYRPLAGNVQQLEAANCTIAEAQKDLHNMQFGDDPCGIRTCIDNRPANTDFMKIMNHSNPNVAPATYELLQKAQSTSAAEERSFFHIEKTFCAMTEISKRKMLKYTKCRSVILLINNKRVMLFQLTFSLIK